MLTVCVPVSDPVAVRVQAMTVVPPPVCGDPSAVQPAGADPIPATFDDTNMTIRSPAASPAGYAGVAVVAVATAAETATKEGAATGAPYKVYVSVKVSAKVYVPCVLNACEVTDPPSR